MPLERARRELDRLVPAGSTSLVDAAYTGVIAADTAPGPKLLVLLTDGRNNASWLQARDVIDAARRHEVVAYAVSVGSTPSPLTATVPTSDRGVDVRNGAIVELRSAGGRERFNDADRLLRALGKETGGRLITATWNDDLSALFRSILDEYRQRYILSFRPEGVGHGDGWHTLSVKLRHGAKGDVYARSGYWSR